MEGTKRKRAPGVKEEPECEVKEERASDEITRTLQVTELGPHALG